VYEGVNIPHMETNFPPGGQVHPLGQNPPLDANHVVKNWPQGVQIGLLNDYWFWTIKKIKMYQIFGLLFPLPFASITYVPSYVFI
jgi:hypothetical protein